MPAPIRPSPPPASRGLSLLECVFAVVLLAMLAVSIGSALGYTRAEQTLGQQRLGAYEVANRLVLQWLDDQDSMPDKNRVIEWGPYVFTWDMKEDNVTMEVNDPRLLRAATDADAAVPVPAGNEEQGLSRFKQIDIFVYPADRQTGQRLIDEPTAILTRVYDPFAVRNVDAVSRLDENDISRILQELTGGRMPNDALRDIRRATTGTPGGAGGGGGGRRGGGGGGSGGGR